MKLKLTILFSCLGISLLFAQGGIVKGRVYDAVNNQPIAFATVSLKGTSTGTTTDIDGNYEIKDIKPGFYDVVATFLGYKNGIFAEAQITNSRPTILDFALEEQAEQIETVEVSAGNSFVKTEESPVSLRTISTTEIQRNPGGTRDISRVVQNLPGVTSTVAFRNDLIIRGGAPNENRFYLDDIEVPNINHFATQGGSGGPTGMINVDLIREVNFFSGAFPANRANTLSSVFQFNQKNGRDDKLGMTFTIGSSDVALSVEGPFSKKNKNTTFIASVRQSYLQGLFSLLKLPFLPTYNDYQFKIRHRSPNNKHEFYITSLGALDQFKLNFKASETESQKYLLANLPVSPQWNYTIGGVYKNYYKDGFFTFVLSRNMLNNESYKYEYIEATNSENLNNKLLDYKSQEIENKLRIENLHRMGKWKFNSGVLLESVKYTNRTFQKLGSLPAINYATDLSMVKYGLFGQVSGKFLGECLTVSAGFRMDGNNYSSQMSNPLEQFSPRVSLSYALTDRMSLNFNSGLYYQLPPYTALGFRDNTGTLVNEPNLKYIRCMHIVGGIEYNTKTNTRFTIEGYYKNYSNYPFLTRPDRQVSLANLGAGFGIVGNEPAISNNSGRSYGLEVLAQQKLFKGFYGILAYTLGFSEFQNGAGQYIASSWDSRHIVNLTLGKQFKKDWEIGARFRLQTGLPTTPFDLGASALVSNWDARGQGITDFSQLNTQRTSISHQLDFRVDKKWYFKKWSLNLYLDIRNAYANKVTGQFALNLDRDANGQPQIINAGQANESYLLKQIDTAGGTPLPTLGVIIQL